MYFFVHYTLAAQICRQKRHVLQERPIGGLDHQIWGLMLLVVALRGAGLFSLDTLFLKIWGTVEPRKRSWITKGHATS